MTKQKTTTAKNAKKSNIYTKLQTTRIELQKLNLKKSGKNTFQKYSYYELSDFLPQLNRLMLKHKLTTRYSLSTTSGTLVLIDTEKPDEVIVFTVPMAELQLKGGQPIQNLGGQITYIRRYLLMMAFEIVESDYVDGQKRANEQELDNASIKKLKSAQTAKELATFAKEIQKEKGEDYRPSLLKTYNERKKELENENK